MAVRSLVSPLIHRRVVALLWCTTAALTLLVPLQSMAAPSDSGPPEAEQELDEVIVEGSPLWKLRREIRETEDRFYARYNELNTNDDFDVYCAKQAALGSRLRSTRCRIAFYQDAEIAAVQAYLTGGFAPDPEIVFLERWDEYRRQALAVINSDVNLRRLVHRREELGKSYQKARKDYFKDRWIRW
jgi:hypothetical protein